MSRSRRHSPCRQRRRSRTQEEIKQNKKKYRHALKAQRERELAKELEKAIRPSLCNRTSEHATLEEEAEEREEMASRFINALRPQLPGLIASLDKIKDFRNPKKIKHQLTLVVIYGLLCFVLQIS